MVSAEYFIKYFLGIVTVRVFVKIAYFFLKEIHLLAQYGLQIFKAQKNQLRRAICVVPFLAFVEVLYIFSNNVVDFSGRFFIVRCCVK